MTSSALISHACDGLNGVIDIPGDKSVSHRALILGGMATGTTRISGLLTGEDVLSTLGAVKTLGVSISTDPKTNDIFVDGVGTAGFISPDAPLDLGNAGTGVRLLMGAVAGQPVTAEFSGDASLSVRPMRRITDPLAKMGAQIAYLPEKAEKGFLPVSITGAAPVLALDYTTPVASAQIKSAIMLAALNARGQTVITEPHISRDHTESMLRHFGIEIDQKILADGSHQVTLAGGTPLSAKDIVVPRDPSSAAFAIIAALITPNSDIHLPAISLNPQRTGLLTTLLEMGADITITDERIEGGEKVGDLSVKSSQLSGIEVPAERAASMIDEYPVLAIAAASATGTTYMPGIAELRVKETDRIATTAAGLAACGVEVAETQDSLSVTGTPDIAGGATINSSHDHRIAMSFLVLGMVSKTAITVTDIETIATSFPGFAELMNRAGAQMNLQGEDR